MSVLADCNIEYYLANEGLVIEPFDHNRLQPASYDVSLSTEFIDYKHHKLVNPDRAIDPYNISEVYCSNISTGSYTIYPGGFVLGSTVEYVEIPNGIVCRVEGKSSLARLGLIVHATAGFVDPGFKGNITLEMFNMNCVPIKLTAGMKIAQLSFQETMTPSARPYGCNGLGSKYQYSKGTIKSRYSE